MLSSCVNHLLLLGKLFIPNVTAQSVSLTSLNNSPNGSERVLRAKRALISLEKWYDSESGLWESTGWWNGANIVTMIGNLAVAAPNGTNEEQEDKKMLYMYASTIFAAAAYRAPSKNPNPDAEKPKNETVVPSQQANVGTGYHKYLDPKSHAVHIVYPSNYSIIQRDIPDMAALAGSFANRNSWPTHIDPYSFLDGYYDDDLWWALAWITAYDVTKHKPYLALAEGIFAAVSKSWPTKCHGGGIYWNMTSGYVNAIANELFFGTAAHLANRVEDGKEGYVDWAKKSLDWFKSSGMINADNVINDGLDENCKNNEGIVWSYNQGVILGGLVELERTVKDGTSCQLAIALAYDAIDQLSDDGAIIHDVCEDKDCGADGTQFKGIFVRNLDKLQSLVGPMNKYLLRIFRFNAESLWQNRGEWVYSSVLFGVNWARFNPDDNPSVLSSGMDCLVADLQPRS